MKYDRISNIIFESFPWHMPQYMAYAYVSYLSVFYMQIIDNINILQKISDCKQERQIKVCYFIIRAFTGKQTEKVKKTLIFREFVEKIMESLCYKTERFLIFTIRNEETVEKSRGIKNTRKVSEKRR